MEREIINAPKYKRNQRIHIDRYPAGSFVRIVLIEYDDYYNDWIYHCQGPDQQIILLTEDKIDLA